MATSKIPSFVFRESLLGASQRAPGGGVYLEGTPIERRTVFDGPKEAKLRKTIVRGSA